MSVRRASSSRTSAGVDPFAGDAPTRAAPVSVSVDVALLTIRQGRLSVLLVRSGDRAFAGRWSLPGRLLRTNEDLDEAAGAVLVEQAALPTRPWHLEQLRTYGAARPDPRGQVVSVAYLGLVPAMPSPAADPGAARLWPLEDLWAGEGPSLAFDHDRVVADAVERVRSKLEYTSLATSFVEEPFTIGDLRRVYEAVWGVPLHQANFRRKVLSTPGFVVPTGGEVSVGRGPRTELYRRGDRLQLHPPMLRPEQGRD